MKAFFISILKFIPAAIVFYVGALFIWGNLVPADFRSNLFYRGSPGHMFTRLKEVKNSNVVDILVLGSSHAYRGFDPRILSAFGYSTFNLGSSAQTPQQTDLLLTRYLDHLNPKLVIYEVFPLTFNLDGVESSLDVIANDKNDLKSLEMALEINNIKVYNTLMVTELNDMLRPNQFLEEPLRRGTDTYISGGFVETRLTDFKPKTLSNLTLELNPAQLSKFAEIIGMLKAKGITVILVFAPVSSALYQSYSDVDAFDDMMKKYSTYYNFNKILSLTDSLYFYDSHHLNQQGVELFNSKLIEVLGLKSTDFKH
jgi:hypothetical protein